MMSVCPREMRNTSSIALMVRALGIQWMLAKMSFWNRFWL